MKKKWLSPSDAIDILSKKEKTSFVLYYELAPTGYVHAGIIRTMLHLEKIKSELIKKGFNVSSMLRINDRYVLKSKNYIDKSRFYFNTPLLYTPSPVSKYSNFLEWGISEIFSSMEKFELKFDKIFFVSEMYESKGFKDLVDIFYLKKDKVTKYLGGGQNKIKPLFHPLCEKCKKIYYAETSLINQFMNGKYICKYCGCESTYLIHENKGLISFKIETALTWKYINADIDFHGTNHEDVAKFSEKIYEILFNDSPPLLYEINVTLGNDKKMLSKSKKKFLPFNKFDNSKLKNLKELLVRTDNKKLLQLPPDFM